PALVIRRVGRAAPRFSPPKAIPEYGSLEPTATQDHARWPYPALKCHHRRKATSPPGSSALIRWTFQRSLPPAKAPSPTANMGTDFRDHNASSTRFAERIAGTGKLHALTGVESD